MYKKGEVRCLRVVKIRHVVRHWFTARKHRLWVWTYMCVCVSGCFVTGHNSTYIRLDYMHNRVWFPFFGVVVGVRTHCDLFTFSTAYLLLRAQSVNICVAFDTIVSLGQRIPTDRNHSRGCSLPNFCMIATCMHQIYIKWEAHELRHLKCLTLY